MSETPPEDRRHPLESHAQREQESQNRPKHPLEEQPDEPTEQPKRRQVRVNIAFQNLPQRATVTFWLIIINIAIFIVQYLSIYELLPQSISNQMLLIGWNDPRSVLVEREYYRLFTAMFLHGSIAHIFFNSYALYVIGANVEKLFGHVRFLVVYILGGLCGSILSIALGNYNVPSIGASGAVFAIWGAEVIHLYTHRNMYGETVVRQRLQSNVLFMGINLVLGFLSTNIDNWGHIGGLLGGAALTWFVGPKFQPTADHENQRVLVKDLNPLLKQFNNLFIFVSGMIAVLILATLFVPPV